MNASDRRIRDNQLAYERMKGATIRGLSKHFNLSKSQVHRIVANVEILIPAPFAVYSLVPLATGGYTAAISYDRPRQRAYKVRDHRRLYAGMA